MNINKLSYDKKTDDPIIEQINMKSNIIKEQTFIMNHCVLLLKKGTFAFEMPEGETIILKSGEMAFLPIGLIFTARALERSELIIIRLSYMNNWKKYCKICEKKSFRGKERGGIKEISKQPKVLPIRKYLNAYIEELLDYILIPGKDGQMFAELKAKEFLVLIQHYYPLNEMDNFFADIAGKEISFVEYVQENWSKYSSINEFAAAIGLTARQFNARFVRTFERTPYQWIIENKARLLQYELARTNKPFKQISMENRFKTLPHFNTFCKIHLGKTPSEIRGVSRKHN